MKVIFGLGNNEKQFNGTRHNLGHWLINKLSRDSDLKELIGKKVLKLEKNKKFMNEAALSLKKIIDIKNFPLNNLLVINDDWDLPLGTFKLQRNRSSARHKGVQSIIDLFHSQDFWRLRIGMGPVSCDEKADFVLGKLKKEEMEKIESVLPLMVEEVRKWVIK